MLTELHGENGVLSFEASYINEQNKEQPCFNLPKRDSLIVVVRSLRLSAVESPEIQETPYLNEQNGQIPGFLFQDI